MCTELGPNTNYLHRFIEEAGGTQLCSPTELSGCSAEQAEWYARLSSASAAETAELRASVLAEIDAAGKGRPEDRGPWPCAQLVLPTLLLSAQSQCEHSPEAPMTCRALVPDYSKMQAMAAKRDRFARCLAKIEWRDEMDASHGKPVWEVCPSRCPEQAKAAIPERQKWLTKKLRQLDKVIAGDLPGVQPKEEL
jgi:hypothetical protein